MKNIETRIPKEDYYDLLQEQDYYNPLQEQINKDISNTQNINFRMNRIHQINSRTNRKNLKLENKINILTQKREELKAINDNQNTKKWEITNKKINKLEGKLKNQDSTK